ncbi:MAG: cation transporter [Desulfobulbaceae bacterium]|nr:cation transporter [Desulfobulbaceae bacterium]
MPTIKIKGMSCNHCVDSVTKALVAIDGVTNVTVNLENGEARYDEEKPVGLDVITNAIIKTGFEVK